MYICDTSVTNTYAIYEQNSKNHFEEETTYSLCRVADDWFCFTKYFWNCYFAFTMRNDRFYYRALSKRQVGLATVRSCCVSLHCRYSNIYNFINPFGYVIAYYQDNDK